MEFMVEIVITAFALGGIVGAVIALHLSANLKPGVASNETEYPALQHIPVKIQTKSRIPHNRRRLR